jgi:ketosteroid isomerase-like protein
VRKAFEYWNRGDLDALMDLVDKNVVVRADENWPERAFYGKDAVRSFYEGLAETVGSETVIEDLIDAGGRGLREDERTGAAGSRGSRRMCDSAES